jgi:ribosomal protein S12 methylthiotransferase
MKGTQHAASLQKKLGERTCSYSLPLIIGSSASRNPSPKKLNANMVIVIARPGAIAKCGEVRIARHPSESIPPQLGTGGLTPKPMKLKVDSVKIKPGIRRVNHMTIGPMVFGRR